MAQTSPVSIQGPNVLVSRAITQADANTTVAAIELPAKSFVPPWGVSLYVAEVWAGGTPSHNVGDGDNDDGWIDTTDITETTVGTYSGDGGDTLYAISGKYYAAADTIDVTVAASGTDGTSYLIVRYYDFSDLDLGAA